MLKIDDINKLKFTKIRDWRINFKYDNVQYSLNGVDDCESIIRLINLDTKEEVASIYGNLYAYDYIKVKTYDNHNKPLIYSHIDKLYFVESLYKYNLIDCDRQIKNNVDKNILKDKINRLQREIIMKQEELNKCINKLLKI